MELLRENIADFFLTSITVAICSQTITIIIDVYTIIQGVISGSGLELIKIMVRYFLINIFTLVHFCYSAHIFTQQVSGVCLGFLTIR